MFRWVDAKDSYYQFAGSGTRLIPQESKSVPSTENNYQFAAEHNSSELRLYIKLLSEGAGVKPPTLSFLSAPAGCKLEITNGKTEGAFSVCVVVPPAPAPAYDDELTMHIVGDSAIGFPDCRIVLRRTTCNINTALMARHHASIPLRQQTRAAILWYSWKRYQEVIGLKRFTSGKSGSDVVVLRPKLRDPDTSYQTLEGSGFPGVISNAWGSYLLVKTGEIGKVREEWDRFQTFLVDRLHPFMARSEAYLTVRPESDAPDVPAAQSTIIGSFLGGDLLQLESFELLLRGGPDIQQCKMTLDKLISILAPWYAGCSTLPLGSWHKMFRYTNDQSLLLFGKYDLTKKTDREQYSGTIAWDIDFAKEAHLSHHLLGKNKTIEGLLYRLMQMPVRYSLTHGDLHPRNILTDRHNVWLIDFGETGVAPTLFDFAKLEVYLRLWCLQMTPGVKNFDDAAIEFETHLLDNVTASEGSLEPICDMAANLGASPDHLLKIAHCISSKSSQN